jgi:hypothetical protein
VTYFEYLRACERANLRKEQILSADQFLALPKPARESLERKMATGDDDGGDPDHDDDDEEETEEERARREEEEDEEDEPCDDGQPGVVQPKKKKERAMSLEQDQIAQKLGFQSVADVQRQHRDAVKGTPAPQPKSKTSRASGPVPAGHVDVRTLSHEQRKFLEMQAVSAGVSFDAFVESMNETARKRAGAQ